MAQNVPPRKFSRSRRSFLSGILATPILTTESSSWFHLAGLAPKAASVARFTNPNGQIFFELFSDKETKLRYRVLFKRQPMIEYSTIEAIIDDVNLSQGAEIGRPEPYGVKEKYPWRGVHSQAVDHYLGFKIPIKQAKNNINYLLDVRLFNDGVAFRYVVPGNGKPRIADEASFFTLLAGSTVWYHDFEGHYEGIHTKKQISEVKEGEWAATPLTIKLPNNAGYAAITEAALINYSGMGLQADGRGGFKLRLAHHQPASYPFRLRYAADVERLAKPASIEGTITSPWRVIMIGADLNTLVNCDIVHNVSPPPDKRLFPDGLKTSWIKPGRAVWKYLDGGENTLDEMKEFSRLAGQLGFEYNLVEGFWQRWDESQMRELTDYSRQQKVGVWFWKHSRDLRTPEARRKFFTLCREVGVVGAKIDFFDHEAKEIIDLYQTLLKEAAESKLMIDFHGANKPAGESRTWPNEMTREAIYGLEHRRTVAWAPINTTLPFTRMLAGHADYTAVHFGERRKETSWAHQIATAAIFTSPLLVFGAHPKNILANPAVEIIKSIPGTWDETIVLPVSEIGEIAAFARRHGNIWFLAIMNGPTARNIKIPLVFLENSPHQAILVGDQPDEPAAVKIENTSVDRKNSLSIEMRGGGGFIARFSKRAS